MSIRLDSVDMNSNGNLKDMGKFLKKRIMSADGIFMSDVINIYLQSK